MKQNLATLFAGVLFGLGLGVAQMTDRARVPGFLDVTGVWDPTLMLVLCGAIAITVVTFRLILRRDHPVLDKEFYLPTRNDIDLPLIVGSAIFGVGWAVGGWCPAPGIASLPLGTIDAVYFVVSLAVGTKLFHWAKTVRSAGQA